MDCALNNVRRMRKFQVWSVRGTAIGGNGTQQRLHHLGQTVSLQINLRKEIAACLVVPLDISPAQACDETLDVTQRQPKIVRNRG
jgi:hypothetical protein